MSAPAPRAGGPARAGVLGHPIAHSLSPVLHRAAYASLGLTDWRYTSHDVTEDGLAGFVAGCGPEWAGLSLTMPLKRTVLGLLDAVEPLAEAVGAVNTLLFSAGGLKVGANTDVYGIATAVRLAGADSGSSRPTGVIVGGGATAASAVAALGELGITRPAVLVRSKGRAGAVIRAANSMGVEPELVSLDSPRAGALVRSADVVVSTIPGGASDRLVPLVEGVRLGHGQVLLDVVYEGWPTAFPLAWRGAGGTAVPGSDMLLHQAVEQVRLMTGRSPAVEPMRTALDLALAGG
ncbi:shikimate dehydrogenase [Pseudactinotalea sp. HY160]|uniref:shikimate dehydrogenase n=1 Tax=Pseudactinotalea sp. HY160 TaxID=2654490 RepID=UPI0013109A80|nr:shikimate dehydrogenase [Pseudactinotalea sp. HY160]